NVEKLYITVANDRREELERILTRYGFQIEGVSARRYRRGSSEWVWGKRLVTGVVKYVHLASFVRQHLFEERGFEVRNLTSNCFLAERPIDVLGRLSQQKAESCLVYVQNEKEQGPDAFSRARRLAKGQSLRLVFIGT